MTCQEFTTHPLPTTRGFQDLTGQTFNRLTVESFAGRRGRNSYWNCVCSCGGRTTVWGHDLKKGHTKSCRCLQLEVRGTSSRIHGEAHKTSEYAAYINAKQRCNNPNNSRYADWGGRGIEFRFNSYEEFLAEVGRKPSPNHSIDRKDNNGHYEQGNVKWSTPTEQSQNRRSRGRRSHIT